MPSPMVRRKISPHVIGRIPSNTKSYGFNCPICGTRMIQVGLAQLAGEKVFITLECPACHYRMQQRK